MKDLLKQNRLVWLAAGLILGAVLASLVPDTPLHASATDRIDTFSMATGAVDDSVEAVFFLDHLTGELNATVLGKQGNGFTAFYTYGSVFKDLGIEAGKKPRFMMVTGNVDMRRGGGASTQPSRSVVYVAEVTSGKVAAYGIPWSPGYYASGRPIKAQLIGVGLTPFRATGGMAPVAP